MKLTHMRRHGWTHKTIKRRVCDGRVNSGFCTYICTILCQISIHHFRELNPCLTSYCIFRLPIRSQHPKDRHCDHGRSLHSQRKDPGGSDQAEGAERGNLLYRRGRRGGQRGTDRNGQQQKHIQGGHLHCSATSQTTAAKAGL